VIGRPAPRQVLCTIPSHKRTYDMTLKVETRLVRIAADRLLLKHADKAEISTICKCPSICWPATLNYQVQIAYLPDIYGILSLRPSKLLKIMLQRWTIVRRYRLRHAAIYTYLAVSTYNWPNAAPTVVIGLSIWLLIRSTYSSFSRTGCSQRT